MNEEKIAQWKENFNNNLQHLQVEFASFFLPGNLIQSCQLTEDKTAQSLSVAITDASLPEEVKERIMKAFLAAKP